MKKHLKLLIFVAIASFFAGCRSSRYGCYDFSAARTVSSAACHTAVTCVPSGIQPSFFEN